MGKKDTPQGNQVAYDDRIPDEYTRVTEVLSAYNDFSGIDPQVLANAADRGQRVHAYIEKMMVADPFAKQIIADSCDRDCSPYLKSFAMWQEAVTPELVHQEIRLNYAKEKVSGRVDMIAKLKGDGEKLTIIDFKTPNAPKKSWALQTAAYQLMAEDILGIKISRRLCVLLRKDGSPAHIEEYTENLHDFHKEMFLKALALHRFFKN